MIFLVFIFLGFLAFKFMTRKALGGSVSELVQITKDEKVGFQNLMMNTCDETVLAYIDILKRLADFAAKSSGSQNMTTGMQMKYKNAFALIAKSENVTLENKRELAKMFCVMGVPVSVD